MKHISYLIQDARERANAANHHIYRAGFQDTAYELNQALKDLNAAVEIVKGMQRDYPIADPKTIDTTVPPLSTPWPGSIDQDTP